MGPIRLTQTYAISPMYVMVGASIRPVPKPRITVATKICVNVLEKYSRAHARMCGIFTINMARLRPSGPTNRPEQNAPNGWHMDEMLPN